MRKKVLDEVVNDLLSIPPLIRRSVNRKVLKTAFTQIGEGISVPHMEIMLILRETERQHIAEIGERLLIPKPQMTHLINRLVNLDLLERQADEMDRRIINVSLTDKGKKMLAVTDRVLRSSCKEKLSCLTDEELRELSVSLRKLGSILSKLH